jgi:soluble lytic murein transglycosylase-like protein
MMRISKSISKAGFAFAALLCVAMVFGSAQSARAEYAVLRNGQRMHITGYERIGSIVRLQIKGGAVDVDAADLLQIEPEENFKAQPQPQAKPLVAALDVPFGDLIHAASKKHGVEQELIASVIAAESNFNPRAISRRRAQGLMQLMPQTARRMSVTDVFNPAQNIDGGTKYLKELLDLYKQDLVLALAAYNAGPERVEQFGGVPPFAETTSYVRRVARALNEHKGKQTLSIESRLPQIPQTHRRFR